MNRAFVSAAESVSAVLPPNSSVSMHINADGSFSTLLHFASDWMREQGARIGSWYGFDEDTGRCQRDLFVTIDGHTVKGVESNFDVGMSMEECRAENSASETEAAA